MYHVATRGTANMPRSSFLLAQMHTYGQQVCFARVYIEVCWRYCMENVARILHNGHHKQCIAFAAFTISCDVKVGLAQLTSFPLSREIHDPRTMENPSSCNTAKFLTLQAVRPRSPHFRPLKPTSAQRSAIIRTFCSRRRKWRHGVFKGGGNQAS